MLKRKGIVASHLIEKSFSTTVDIHKQGLMWVGKELSSSLPKDLLHCLADFAAIVKSSQTPVKRNKVSTLLPGISDVVCTSPLAYRDEIYYSAGNACTNER